MQSKSITAMQCAIFALCWFNFGIIAAAKAAPTLIPTDGDVDVLNISNLILDGDPEPLFAIIAAGADPNTSVRVPLNFDVYTGTVFDMTADQLYITEIDIGLGGGWSFEGDQSGVTGVLPTDEFEFAYFDSVDWHTADAWEAIGNDAVTIAFAGDQNGLNAALTVFDAIPLGAASGGGTITPTPVISAVPIPASAWLMFSGLLGMVGVARRR